MTAAAFDPGDPSHRRFHAYVPAAFPDGRDGYVDAYVRTVRAGGPAAVRAALDAISESGRRVLRAYAERCASRAVRDGAPELVVLGLVATVIGGLDHNAREALMKMPLLEDACRRLGRPAAEIFADAAHVVGPPGAANLMLWLSRAPADRTLECMGFSAGADETGFRYLWTA